MRRVTTNANGANRLPLRWSSRRSGYLTDGLVLWLSVAVLVALAGAPVVSAQSPDRVLKAASKALGGEKALRQVKSRQSSGTIKRLSDGAQGKYQSATQAPNLFIFSYDLDGFEVASGFNGKSSWARDSRDGLRTLTGALSRDFATEAAYRNLRWLDAKKEKARLVLLPPETINGKSANVVQVTTSKGVKLRLLFDAATSLPVREEFPAGDGWRIFEYDDYRNVNGLLEPHRITLTLGSERTEIQLSEIKHNVTLERSLFDFPRLNTQPLPDVTALLKEVRANEARIDDLLEKYTYTETISRRQIDAQGQMQVKESETFELTFFKGYRIRRQVAKNGKPLSADEEREAQKQVEKRVRDLEKRIAERDKKAAAQERQVAQSSDGSPDPERGQRPSISDILRASQLVNPRRERFRGYDVIVFDFEPLPNYKPQKSYEKFFGKTAGTIWVAVAEKQVVRVEARLIEAFKIAGGLLAKMSEGATFVLEQDRFNDEIWLPTRADINLPLKLFLVKGLNVMSSITYGNYQRFKVESEKERLKDPTATSTSKPPTAQI